MALFDYVLIGTVRDNSKLIDSYWENPVSFRVNTELSHRQSGAWSGNVS